MAPKRVGCNTFQGLYRTQYLRFVVSCGNSSTNFTYKVYMVRYFTHDDVIKWKHFPSYWPIFAGNSSVPGVFPAQRPVMLSFDVFFDLRLNKRLNKQSWGWWCEMLSRPLLRRCNDWYSYIRPISYWTKFTHIPAGFPTSLALRHCYDRSALPVQFRVMNH